MIKSQGQDWRALASTPGPGLEAGESDSCSIRDPRACIWGNIVRWDAKDWYKSLIYTSAGMKKRKSSSSSGVRSSMLAGRKRHAMLLLDFATVVGAVL
jgi:hypothetical protein